MIGSMKPWNNPTINACSDIARQLFIDSGLDYSILSQATLANLSTHIQSSLVDHNREYPFFQMTLNNCKCIKNKSGHIQGAFFTVDGPYFKKREAISFNQDGWIGFAGWASTENTKPFINAFEKWVKELSCRALQSFYEEDE